MSIQQNFPSTRPSLNLNFARSQKLDPRITFTRTSSATRVNSDGLIEVVPANSPRFDFDPISGESLGLLVEEQRTNLLLRSEEFDNAAWIKINTTVSSNDTIAPDGTVSADKIVGNSGQTTLDVRTSTFSVTSGQIYTYSIFLKASEWDIVQIQFNSNIWEDTVPNQRPRVQVNLSTGEVISQILNSGYSVTKYPNEYYKITLTAECVVSGTTAIENQLSQNGTGDGTSGIYIWGAQLEVGSFPTSYIPTTTSTATRTADNASITGSNVESWYRQDEGTFISDSRILQSGVKTQGVWGIGDGTNQISLRSPQVTGDRFRGNIGNIFTVAPGTGDTLLNTFKAAISYTSTVGRLQVGTASNEVTPSQLPINPNTFGVGNLGGGSTPLNGIIKQIVYYPVKLDNNILQTLTK
jgi:hypothetical protein